MPWPFAAQPAAAKAGLMLWLCLYFPRWALQIATRGLMRDLPLVLVKNTRVVQVNALAGEHGIRPGMNLSAAYALQHQLQTVVQDQDAESAALQRMAAWAYGYSHQVLLGRYSLMLEIGGSLKLHGSLSRLLAAINHELSLLGYEAGIGMAPNPTAARLFASKNWLCRDHRCMHDRLNTVSIQELPLEREIRRQLGQSGIHDWRQLQRLPRASLRKRFGPELMIYLQQLLGLRPHGFSEYQPQQNFSAGLQLPASVDSSEALLFAGQRLIQEMSAGLRGLDASTQRVCWRLFHEQGQVSRFELGLQSPDREAGRWLAVFKEHLNSWRLPAPVQRLCLQADELIGHQPRQKDLLDGNSDQEDRQQVLERISARLGEAAVRGVRPVADHRPERAWKYCRQPSVPDDGYTPRRPVWLYPEPQPALPGDWVFNTRAERIEAGWWDQQSYRRDYFVVQQADGRRLWVFREYRPRPGWYVHGVFG